MTITFVTNYVHHHQLPVADELYKLVGSDYKYIASEPLPDWLVKGGYDPSLDRPYIIRPYQSDEEMKRARNLIDESDVVIMGAAPVSWAYARKKANKVTFHYSERWLKNLSLRVFSPRGIYFRLKNFTQFRNKRTYMLCASAFTAKDVRWYLSFPHKCFKWGYFTKVEKIDESNIEGVVSQIETPQGVSIPKNATILWCARFLELKHPELPVLLAERLKKKGYSFCIDMYGSGEKLEEIKKMAETLGVEDVVNFCGNVPNEEMLRVMRNHEIFLFTSDRNEGWGAVLNESMSNGCAVVGSDEIGSVPFLIQDGKNGLVFKSKSIDSLYSKVSYLLDNPKDCARIRREALKTMQKTWSPQSAAKAFFNLASYAIRNELDNYKVTEGPASWAK